MFDEKYFNYGLIKIVNGCAHVYDSYSSYTIIYGFGLPLVEAYWSGRSIIAKDSAGHRYRFYGISNYEPIYD